MRAVTAKRHGGLELKMTPMIDVVFLLLVFFLWTSSFNEPEFDLPSALATDSKAAAESRGPTDQPAEMFDEIIVEVAGPQDLKLNGQRIETLAQLEQRFIQIAELGAQPSVIIDPTEATEIGRAIRVYDTARAAGFERVLFAAKAP
ncbi:ExbD/TolR family protein [Roseimaritima ulvae]|uniref:Biopolymer transport protein ExbD/TolR n=1 Tax=Roseimaritima ulvae TaxID=980254 RepID=A0A5B9QKU3_9BACT|nr:biopolymer transporter ExbD [Roseimaritima ulvae]QEG39698.1 Biopolymer transport protein ExbD/TolR [Roseimaritima ulvae]